MSTWGHKKNGLMLLQEIGVRDFSSDNWCVTRDFHVILPSQRAVSGRQSCAMLELNCSQIHTHAQTPKKKGKRKKNTQRSSG